MPNADYAKQIEARKAALKKMETARIQAESDKKHAEKRLEELYAEVRALGVEPENIEAEIAKLEAEIEEGLQEIAKLIPPEFRDGYKGDTI